MLKRTLYALCGIVALAVATLIVANDAAVHFKMLGFWSLRVADKIALGIAAGLTLAGLILVVRTFLPTPHDENFDRWLNDW